MTTNNNTTTEIDAHRNRLEIIRFACPEHRRQAIRILVQRGEYELSANDPDIWNVRTNVVRALLQEHIPFEWLTHNIA